MHNASNQAQPEVRGYVKPVSSFFTLGDWEAMALRLLDLQERGVDVRGGELSCKDQASCDLEDFNELVTITNHYFGYQLSTEVEKWDLLTKKNVLDFIEDFVNHRLWAFDQQYGRYFPDINKLKFAFFYSRGDIEPYVMLNEEFTNQLYGSTFNPRLLCHYTSKSGADNLIEAIANGTDFDISSFTVMERPFFRPESSVLLTFIGNVRAAFRSDIKSLALTNGRRACNMQRLEYPGHDLNNICYELDSCDGDVRTSLWNEYIATPLEIVKVETR